jgi:tetratricopeptide (TPR) repeat protein
MKRTLLTGILVLTAGISALMAQAPAARPAGQPAAQPAAAPGAPQAAPVTENSLLQSMVRAQQANNPDATIKAAEQLLTTFPNTQLKEAALSFEAAAYEDKKDNAASRAKWEEVLKINPKSIQANLKMGEIIGLAVKDKSLDKDEDVAQANKYVSTAFEIIKTAAKPNPTLTDAQWEDAKKAMEAEGHDALGMMNLNIKKYDVAIQEFQAAATADPQPTYQARLATAMDSAGKHDDAIALCDKILAQPELHPAVKEYVTKLKTQATNAKK